MCFVVIFVVLTVVFAFVFRSYSRSCSPFANLEVRAHISAYQRMTSPAHYRTVALTC